MPSGFTLRGRIEMKGKILKIAQKTPRKFAAAAKAEMEIEKRESQRRTPVLTGKLRDDHKVQEPVISGNTISVTITVGGPEVPYAVEVHENLSAFHPTGQAKFLESTLMESEKFMAARIARRVELDERRLF